MATTEAEGDFPIRSAWAAKANSYRYPNVRQHVARKQIFYANNDTAISTAMRTWMFATITVDGSSTRMQMTGLGL